MIVLADEVGFLMNPSVKKTWAKKGQTPVVVYRNRHHKKVSVLGALALRPATQHIELLCDFHPGSYVRGEQAAAFLRRVLAQFPGVPVDVVWDNLSAHRAPAVKELAATEPRLGLHYPAALRPGPQPRRGRVGIGQAPPHGQPRHRQPRHPARPRPQAPARHRPRPLLLRSCFKGARLALSLASAQ